MSPQRSPAMQAIAAVVEKLRAEGTVALSLATRASTSGNPTLASDLLLLRDRLQGLADEVWKVARSIPKAGRKSGAA